MRQTPTTIERLIAAGLSIAAATACATPHAPSTTPIAPASRSAACTPVPASVPRRDTVTLALTHDVEPSHAPVPRNESERVLFAQLYETLIHLDCLGRPYAGLAASWRSDSSGRRWTLTLRDDARFWDGTPVTARDIVTSWVSRSMAPDAASASPVAASMQVDDERTLTIILGRPRRTVPLVLTLPEFAVTKSDPDAAWPQGTGDYRVEQSDDSSRSATLQRTITLRPASVTADAPVLQFRRVSGTDARDLLDGGVDVLMTDAPAVLDYAATRQDFVIVPLPWDSTYVLLSPARAGQDVTTADSAFRSALARDAVRAEARGSEGPYWWDDTSTCEDLMQANPAPSRPPTHRIVYPQDDRVARDLADRLVALASLDAQSSPRAATLTSLIPGLVGDSARPVATGLPAAAFPSALRSGHDLAYVIPVPHRALVSCGQAELLVTEAPWLVLGNRRDATSSEPARVGIALRSIARVVVPLIDTRSSLIVRRGVSGVALDWDDTPLFAAPPRAPQPPTEHRP